MKEIISFITMCVFERSEKGMKFFMDSEFKNELIDLARNLNIEINDNNAKKFYDYMNLLLEWNEKINLTAITEQHDVILKHFIDSLTVCKYIKSGENIIDVGTGAGFPGIPLSIINEKNKITLLDSLNKRILFLQDVIKKVELSNIEAIHSRIEDFGQNKAYREKYDISISRAVANLSTLVEYLIPMVKVGGKCICMKGSEIDEELCNAEFAIKQLGGEVEKIDRITLPSSDMIRNIVIIKKIHKTPNRYPRKSGTPSKQPLIKTEKNKY